MKISVALWKTMPVNVNLACRNGVRSYLDFVDLVEIVDNIALGLLRFGPLLIFVATPIHKVLLL